MQAKLHRWAAADPGRRFDDLFNFVHDPATLIVAFGRVAGNHGANTPGVDRVTVAYVEERIGVPGFLDDLRAQLKEGTFRPLPVRERKIPKPGGSGKLRSLGIPAVADRVVQAALKLVLEPIFEADFEPVSYEFRPLPVPVRRCQAPEVGPGRRSLYASGRHQGPPGDSERRLPRADRPSAAMQQDTVPAARPRRDAGLL
jgi:hypothetical protein